AKIAERLVEKPGTTEIIERPHISTRREGARITRGNDHPGDRRIRLPFGELSREFGHHGQRHRVERMRPIERDMTRGTAPLEQEIVRAHAPAHTKTRVAAN